MRAYLLVLSHELIHVECGIVHLAFVERLSDRAKQLGELRDVFGRDDVKVVLQETNPERKVDSCVS